MLPDSGSLLYIIIWLVGQECGDDYLDNLWHLTMYYLNSCQRGPHPARFIDGLWSWNRDVQPWQDYFHWNQQSLYWPLHAAGHSDLLKPYLDFRFRNLPQAKADAKEWFGAEGAFVSDIVSARGDNNPNVKNNHTPVAEIAMDFWRQYRYTGDIQFLRERALPYMIEAALYLESRFEKGSDGVYHTKAACPLEGGILFLDATPEIVSGRALFSAVLTALEETGQTHPHAALWREMIGRMVALPELEASPDLIMREGRSYVLNWGWFKGDALESNRLLAAGYRIDRSAVVMAMVPNKEKRPPMPGVFGLVKLMETTYIDDDPGEKPMKYADVMPELEYLCVYPSGLIGLKDKGSQFYNAAVNTVKLHVPGHGGYDRVPIALARLGLGKEAWKIIRSMPARWQYYVNGFGHYNWGMKADRALRYRVNFPLDAADGKTRFPFYSWPFRHMGMESMSVMACAINECLLQSHEGVIRVAPAVTSDQNARFTLHAERGFTVSSEIRDGAPLWIFIHSRSGGALRVQIPWMTCKVFRNGVFSEDLQKGTAELKTSADEKLMFVSEQRIIERWETEKAEYPENQNAKMLERTGYSQNKLSCGYSENQNAKMFEPDGTNYSITMLGLPRMF